MVYMLYDLHRDGARMDYPIGGSGAVVDALVRGLTKHGGELRLNSPVAKLLVDGAGRCNGVELRSGEMVRARTAVVTNAPVWATWSLLPESARSATRESLARAGPADGRPLDPDTPPTPSFVHLHLGIRADGLSEQARPLPRAPLRAHASNDWSTRQALESIHHISIPDREQLTAPGSAVFVSVPSILDPSLAPPGRFDCVSCSHMSRGLSACRELLQHATWQAHDPRVRACNRAVRAVGGRAPRH